MMNYVRVMLRDKEKEMGAGSLINYAVEKSKELPVVVGNVGGNLMGTAEEKWKELAPEIGNMGGDLMGKAEEKWKELPVTAGNLMDKVDEVFPPETRKEQIQHLIQVSQPYIIPAIATAVLIILLYYCGALFVNIIIKISAFFINIIINIIAFIFKTIKSVFCCFGRGTVSGGKVIKMMIAPGTRGAVLIVRSVFESNPAGYFSGLRGK